MNLSNFDEDLVKKQLEQLTDSTDMLSISRVCTKLNISVQNICLLAERIATHICKRGKQQSLGKLLCTYVQLEIILQELERIKRQYHL